MAALAILVTTMPGSEDVGRRLGDEAYSYRFAYRAFRPLLERLGEVVEVDSPESRLDLAARRARERGREPIHLSFRPLQHVYLTSLAPNLAFPFWEFPDVPNEDFDDNPRNNWVRIAANLSAIFCATDFTRDAFLRAGVRTPIATLPVPIREEYFALEPWSAGASGGDVDYVAYGVRCARNGHVANPWAPRQRAPTMRSRARALHEEGLRPMLPEWANRGLDGAIRAGKGWLGIGEEGDAVEVAPSRLDLAGIVYTSILNPFDPRKNWRDLLTAFVLALSDRADATLVLKLVAGGAAAARAVRDVVECGASLAIDHRCKVAVISGYLADEQLLELTRRSTYYVSATRAEGACLPAQDFLAAGRPVIAPRHSALADFLTSDVGLPIESHPEPTCWPHDRSRATRTTWHRIVWQSLHDRLRESYALAHDPEAYARMAERGRERMRDCAAADRVWPRLARAFEPFVDARAALR